MPRATIEQINAVSEELFDKFTRFKQLTALEMLSRVIRGEKNQGRRLILNTGDQFVGVSRIRPNRAPLPIDEMHLLIPNSQLVLSDMLGNLESGPLRMYVGDKNWYIGHLTLATALHYEPNASLDTVDRDQAQDIQRQTAEAVRPVVVVGQDFRPF